MEAAPPTEPALAFRDKERAKEALRAWAEAEHDLNDRRDPLVRGALAAGVTPTEVYDLTRIARSTTARISPGKPADIEVAVPQPPILEYAALLEARAERITNAADAPRPGTYEGNHLIAFALIMRHAAQLISQPPRDPSMSEDAWLQSLAAQYRRQSTELRSSLSERSRRSRRSSSASHGDEQSYAETYAVLADEITRVRRLGEAVWDTFSPDEVAAGRARSAEANRQFREEFAVKAGFDSFAAMSAAHPDELEDDRG